ncbi:hypothetical protein [Salinispora arenicola]|uniref:hypothetical protein n=1 Tax=Salinispora arenicola TaxID=168697 RepID=UPI0027DCB969|nr:hypothetical protein [Salinispora arenicola]
MPELPTAPEMALADPGSAGAGTNVAARTGVALRALATPEDARAVWRTLGEHGRLRDAGPAELPGLLGALDARCPVGVVLSVCVQVASALPVLREQVDGQPEDGPVRTAYLDAIAGHAMLALAATDRDGAGSDLMELGTTVRLNDRSLVLDGGKRWITNAPLPHMRACWLGTARSGISPASCGCWCPPTPPECGCRPPGVLH